MQETSFPVEIILAEDCSTDGTRKICEEYVAKYPDEIKYIWSEHNVGCVANELRAMQAARGKYIAYCEGDDSWTEPWKLQRQVDWMEAHPEYSVTFHRYRNLNYETGIIEDDKLEELLKYGDLDGIDVTMDIFFGGWYTQPLTMVFRREALDLNLYTRYRYFRDMQQIYYLMLNGKCRLLPFMAGLRTKHEGGMASMISMKKYVENSLVMDLEFWKGSKSQYAKRNYLQTLQEAVNVYGKEDKQKARKYAFLLFVLNRKVKRFITNWQNIKKSK